MHRIISFVALLLTCIPAYAWDTKVLEQFRSANPQGSEGLEELYAPATLMIQAAGYYCPRVGLMTRYIFGGGYYAYCIDNRQYKFELTDHGGRWLVTAP
jgi:hypothetical protein